MSGLIEIKMRRYTLFLTEQEIQGMLVQNPELWKTAIGRGKGILRTRKAMNR
jgi:hypothetical protein